MARYIVEFELIEKVCSAFGKLDFKLGQQTPEWQAVRDAICDLLESAMERTWSK